MYSALYLYPDVSGPLNGDARELKYCELCGKPFVRYPSPTEVKMAAYLTSDWWGGKRGVSEIRVDRGTKLCVSCQERPFTQDARVEELARSQEQYREQLPDERQATHNRVYQMPDYRHLNPPREPKIHRSSKAHRAEVQSWREKIQNKFRKSGRLTTAELQELIPNCFVPADAYIRCIGAGLKLRRVGYASNNGFTGRPPRIYVLPGFSPETVTQ
jgi:hypothetical protein